MTTETQGRGRRERLAQQKEQEETPQEGAGAVSVKKRAERKPSGKKVARELGEAPKPIPSRPRYSAPTLGEAGALPPREGALDETVRGIYETIGDDPNLYVPVIDERPAQQLQAALTNAARRLGRPIKTNIRVVDGKQVVYARPL